MKSNGEGQRNTEAEGGIMRKLMQTLFVAFVGGWFVMVALLASDKLIFCGRRFPKVNRFYCYMADLNVLSQEIQERE